MNKEQKNQEKIMEALDAILRNQAVLFSRLNQILEQLKK